MTCSKINFFWTWLKVKAYARLSGLAVDRTIPLVLTNQFHFSFDGTFLLKIQLIETSTS